MLVCICMLVGSGAQAQQAFTDSILQLIKQSKQDSTSVKLWMDLLDYSTRNQADKVNALSAGAMQVAESKNDSLAIAQIIKYKGGASNTLGKRDSALHYYYQSIAILERNNGGSLLASLYNDVARLNRRDNPDRAIGYYDKAMALYTQLNDESGMSTIWNESGVAYEIKNDYAEAEKRYRESLRLAKKLDDKVGVSYALSFIAGVKAAQKQYEEAEKLALEVLTLRRELRDSFALAIALTNMGELYNMTGKQTLAIDYFSQSNAIAGAIGYADIMAHNFGQLASAWETTGNYKEALIAKKQQTNISDSIFQLAKTKQIEELSAKYETAEKEKQLQLQKFDLTRKNYLLLALIALVIVATLLIAAWYRRKQLLQKAQLEKERRLQQDLAVKAVMEAEENERRRIASELHDGVGQLMSAANMNLAAMENEISNLPTSIQHKLNHVSGLVKESCNEVRTVSHSMMPNALLKRGLAAAVRDFLDKIDSNVLHTQVYTEGLTTSMDHATESMLYRIIQECVSNVIKHSRANQLDLTLTQDEQGIQLMIEDNGQGFDVAAAAGKDGIGLRNIQSRVQFLKGTLEVNSAPNKGTVIAIHIPPLLS